MADRRKFEVVIIGAGIAGCSLAHFLAERGLSDVLVIDKEDQPGYHATGRSAAVLVELDDVMSVLQLKILAAKFLRSPPEGFCENPLLRRDGILALFHGGTWGLIRQLAKALEAQGVALELLEPDEVARRFPVVAPGFFDGGVYLREDGHIDVHELLSSYIRHAKKRGVEFMFNAEVKGIKVEKGRAAGVVTDRGEIKADRVVNSGGAWATKIGEMAGALPVKLQPLRRTILSFAAPEGIDVSGLPLIANYGHELYFSPESGGLYASPMDEDPSEPCDAKPDEVMVATTIDRLEKLAPRLVPRSLNRKWAGLRTFAPDRAFVIGEDPLVRGFFWLSGQGGAGIETSPVAGKIAADLVIDGKTEIVDSKQLSPERFKES